MSVSLSKLTVSEMKRHLVTAGLSVTGRKADLIKRLLDAGHVGEVWCLDQLPAEILLKVMGFLPLPALLNLASTCSRLRHFLADPNLWRTLEIRLSIAGHHQETFRTMLEDKGKHARKIVFKGRQYMGGPPRGSDWLALKSVMEVCGSTLTSLTVSYISVEDLGMVADSCGALTSLSVGHFLFKRTRWAHWAPWGVEDFREDWKPSALVAKKFKRLEYFAGDFNWRLVGMSMKTATRFLMALIRSNPSLKRVAIGGVNLKRLYSTGYAEHNYARTWLGESLRRLAKKKGVAVEKREKVSASE